MRRPLRALGGALARLAAAARWWTASWRWLPVAAPAGAVPLLIAYGLGSGPHRLASALLLFPPFLSLVAQDRQRAGFGLVLAGYAAHSALAIGLTAADPEAMAAVVAGGPEYWEKNYAWIRTGIDPEYELGNWLPAHLQQAAGMATYAATSLGLVPLLQGLHEIDLMNYYVGRLVMVSSSTLLATLAGWHAWSIVRGIGYTRIVFEVASWSLERLTGTPLSTRRRRLGRWAAGLLFLTLDGVLKYWLLDPVRWALYGNLAG